MGKMLASERILKSNQSDYNMNFTQNERITHITATTLIVGVDNAKFKHVARAQDFRGIEIGKPAELVQYQTRLC
ncbi:hypothetical protein COHCIP112018_05687 [Cohnella sp. JJ-181]|nr:hypothetical protein COHCIP112018_05687 [Cohnella sp. JJ-181]